jgi:hypothetical protein
MEFEIKCRYPSRSLFAAASRRPLEARGDAGVFLKHYRGYRDRGNNNIYGQASEIMMYFTFEPDVEWERPPIL